MARPLECPGRGSSEEPGAPPRPFRPSAPLFQFALGFKAAHLEGVELKHMGQQLVGQYPIHFHLAGDVDGRGGYDPPTYVRELSIHHTFSRCVTVHGSNGLLVSTCFPGKRRVRPLPALESPSSGPSALEGRPDLVASPGAPGD